MALNRFVPKVQRKRKPTVESQLTHTANAEVLQWWKPSTKPDSIKFKQLIAWTLQRSSDSRITGDTYSQCWSFAVVEAKKQVSIKFKQSNLCRGLQIVESQVTHTANAEVLQWWKPSTKQDSIKFKQLIAWTLQRSSDSRITGDTYSQCWSFAVVDQEAGFNQSQAIKPLQRSSDSRNTGDTANAEVLQRWKPSTRQDSHHDIKLHVSLHQSMLYSLGTLL